ncbi:MAG: hypothetical protein JWO77_3075 [Ilumatobacteraceae bacterium]|nr:hypothetical protein [Ilumatobacteraceae bacterium]
MFLVLGSVAITSLMIGHGVGLKLVTADHRLVIPTSA